MALAIFSIAISVAIGALLARILWPRRLSGWPYAAARASLAVGLGCGISSSLFFVSLSAFGPSRKSLFIFEIFALIFLALISLYGIRTKQYPLAPPPGQITHSRIYRFLLIGFFAALVSAAASFIMFLLMNPHGGWDAWAIWNLRSRFFFRGAGHWADAFSPLLSWSHTDYPLLLPGIITRGWMYIGNETSFIPASAAFLFTFSTLGLVFSSLSALRGKGAGLFAGILMSCTPFFILHGASQYADVPLSFFIAATIVLFFFREALPEAGPGLVVIAGMTAGLSCWTKNEGSLFLICLVIARFVITAMTKRWKIFAKDMLYFALGLIPVACIIAYFKVRFPVPNDLLSAQAPQLLAKNLTDASRYAKTASMFFTEMMNFGQYAVPLVPIMFVYAFISGIRIEDRQKPNMLASILTLCLVLAGYFFIYVTNPYDISWLLGTSLNRVLLQLWPSFIFLFFMAVSLPGRAGEEAPNLISILTSTALYSNLNKSAII